MTFNLDLLHSDQSGIVHNISRCLSAHDVSVEEMQTDLQHAPMGGDMLFQARALVRLPANLGTDELGPALEGLAGALVVDLTLSQDTDERPYTSGS